MTERRPLMAMPIEVVSYGNNNANQRGRVMRLPPAGDLRLRLGGAAQDDHAGAEVCTYDYDALSRRKRLLRPNGARYGAGRKPDGNIMNNPAGLPAAHHYNNIGSRVGNGCQVVPKSVPCPQK